MIVSLDNSAPATAAADLAAALTMWRAVTTFEVTDRSVDGVPRLPVRFESAAPLFRGLYDDERGVVIVNSRLGAGHETAVTLAHELGHALGLWHTEAGVDSVMLPGNLEIEPTSADAAALASLWGTCAGGSR
jgi:Zn-dependent peptidase ImmA (M78 family)